MYIEHRFDALPVQSLAGRVPAWHDPGDVWMPQANTLAVAGAVEAVVLLYAKAGREIAAHWAMLMGGITIGGVPPHSGMPDPEGRDRRHNTQGLRNALKNELDNMHAKWGKTKSNLEEWLLKKGWEPEQVQHLLSELRVYVKEVLPIDVEFKGVPEALQLAIEAMLKQMGVIL